MRGKLFVVSGPSGVGKNTLLNAVVARALLHLRHVPRDAARRSRRQELLFRDARAV